MPCFGYGNDNTHKSDAPEEPLRDRLLGSPLLCDRPRGSGKANRTEKARSLRSRCSTDSTLLVVKSQLSVYWEL
ncbi:hypothetical protein [Scytonema sp. HK-05]|uniref:hypothetical protein n=1 Tax=Scytonema sp. HK-05 TaxID=1137095 RepID=UPI000B01604C|nr:hypothetical protein [Scytonema sp. HK-05]